MISNWEKNSKKPRTILSNFTTPIRLEPRFSIRFALVLIGIHNGALLLLLPLTLPLTYELALAAKFGIGFLVLTSAWHTARRHLLFYNHPLYECILYYDDISHDIRVRLKSGQETKIASGSYSHSQLVVLRLQGVTDGNALIIFPDALDMQTFRQLRAHLRHG